MMLRLGVLAVFCFTRFGLAQTPPAPGAVLVAGSIPTQLRATAAAMQPLSIALAPDGGLYVAEIQRIWRVSADGLLAAVPGPWDDRQSLLNAITADRAGNLYVADAGQQVIWKSDPLGRAAAIAGKSSPPVSASSLAIDSRG